MEGNLPGFVKPRIPHPASSPAFHATRHPSPIPLSSRPDPMSSTPAPMAVRYQRGVYLPAQDLWLDPWDDQPFAFVSHAHADHIGKHREVILSTVTSRLMHARLPDQKRLEHRLDFLQTAADIRPGLRITLYPAGHIAGSAQSFIETDDGTGSLLYTGDFKLRAGLSAEPTGWTHADTLIMETTFGLPRFRFPPTEEVLAQVVKVLPRGPRRRRGAGALRLFAGQEPGNPLRVGPRGVARDAARRGASHDGEFTASCSRISPLRAVRPRQTGGQGASSARRARTIRGCSRRSRPAARRCSPAGR